MASQQNWRRGFFGSLATLVASAIVVLGFGLATAIAPNSDAAPNPSATATATPSATPTPSPSPSVTCDAQYVQKDVDHGNDGKVDAAHKAAIDAASAGKSGDELAKARTQVLLDEAAYSGRTLAILSYGNGLHKDPNDWQGLVTADGKCLSQKGIDLHNQLKGALTAGGTKVTAGKAPQGGYNTGVDDDKFVVAERPGIDGDRNATIISYPDGTIVYILDICGNLVLPTQPVEIPTSPKIPQPEKPVTPIAPVCPPGTTGTPPDNCLEWKIPAQGSFQQGNAPTGGGNNDTSGPGEYIAPPAMQQPSAVQPAPPAPPAPQPAPVGNEPAPNPNPEGPRPTAPPEPAAPAPSEAVDSCVPAPGKTTC